MSGYSDKSLSQKLGIKENSTVYLVNGPGNYDELLKPLPASAKITNRIIKNIDIVHLFVTSQIELRIILPKLNKIIFPNGVLWISWPKKTANIPSDLDENMIRNIVLKHGLVDIKVCAIDENWSGLKFVYRTKNRK